MDHINFSVSQVIEIKTTRGLVFIQTKHILFIKAKRKFSILYLDNDKSIVSFHMLSRFNKFLVPPCFYRCHNSYIVNCHWVESISNRKLFLLNKQVIPVSKKNVFKFKENLRSYLLSQY